MLAAEPTTCLKVQMKSFMLESKTQNSDTLHLYRLISQLIILTVPSSPHAAYDIFHLFHYQFCLLISGCFTS